MANCGVPRDAAQALARHHSAPDPSDSPAVFSWSNRLSWLKMPAFFFRPRGRRPSLTDAAGLDLTGQ